MTRREPQPMEMRQGSFEPASVRDDARTIEVVWTTGSRVLRRRFFGDDFIEELVVSDDAVRLDRLNAGAAVLNTHGSYDLSNQLGVVERAWIEGGQGHALLRFSEREDVDPLWRDIKSGIIRNVSVGYAIHRREITERDEGPDEHRITDWEPYEISMVPVPADAGAQTRSGEERVFPCEIIKRDDGQAARTRMRMRARAAGL